MNPHKKRMAVFGASGCRACENALLDIHFQVQSLSRWADVVYWPYLLGSGEQELDALEEIDVCFFTGAVSTSDDRRMAQKLRAKSQVLVACGACAAFGGMPGLSNLGHLPGHLSADPQPHAPQPDPGHPALPVLEKRVSALGQVVAVDYRVPGCQPVQSLLWAAIQALVSGPRPHAKLAFSATRLPFTAAQALSSGVLPPKGTCFAGQKAVCASCSRVKEEKKFKTAVRPYERYEESGRCLLEQGLVCLGIATREGCGGLCTGVGQPCRGCFGKAEAVYDPGAKMVSAIASTFASDNPAEIEEITSAFMDLSGTLYRYTLASQCALLSKE
jgi:F420-non-reducing hydrogenase small subunit